jgi:TolB protein
MIFMAVVTLLALAIVVFSLILGVRAGQQQREFRRQQEIAIALQKAIDLRNEGLMEQSVDEYRHVLDLDPGNVAAGQGLEALLAAGGGAQPQPAALIPTATDPASVVAASSDQGDSSALLRPQAVLSTGGTPTIATPLPAVAIQSPAPLVTIAGGPTPAPAALPPATTTDLLARAQTAARAGRWQETVTLLEPLATQSATNPTIASLLFDGYLNLAAERDNEEQLEAALGYYDKALAIRPTVADVQTERTLISSYLDVLTAWEVQWPKAITLLTEMYAIDPQYRDVKARLTEALPAYGEALAEAGDWCAAATQFQSATALETPDNALLTQLAQATSACQSGGTPVAGATDLLATPPVSGTGTPVATGESARLPSQASGAGPMAGRILYSATDSVDGRTRVLSQSVAGGATSVVIEDGAQPALRSDGLRFVYRNMRSDLGGLSAVDPATNVFFRITDYTEDILPSWDPTGGRVVFASNREGDRRWRIYAVWAEENGEVAMLSFGEAPAWNPVSDLIVHRGCDETGNGCGLWIMDGAGSNRRPITNVPGDNRPAWAPNGSAVVFMSDGRDGNTDIYRLDVSATGTPGAVVRLTNDSAVDAAPVVSPDGQWVAFMSNRDGAWKIYAVPMAGGATQLVATIKGDAGDWHMQSMLWVR